MYLVPAQGVDPHVKAVLVLEWDDISPDNVEEIVEYAFCSEAMSIKDGVSVVWIQFGGYRSFPMAVANLKSFLEGLRDLYGHVKRLRTSK